MKKIHFLLLSVCLPLVLIGKTEYKNIRDPFNFAKSETLPEKLPVVEPKKEEAPTQWQVLQVSDGKMVLKNRETGKIREICLVK